MKRIVQSSAAVLLGAVALAACQSAGNVRQVLDRSSGVTWTASANTATYARTEARYSRSARDYIYLGPVAVNRQGTVDCFLWAGVATTLDKNYLVLESPRPERLVIRVRGEPIELALAPWDERVPELGHVKPYRPTVDVGVALAARITLDQLELIDAAPPESIQIGFDGAPTQTYTAWEKMPDWGDFVARVTGAN